MVNVVISNVRGPSRPMYLHGARMCSHFPVSIPAHSIALNLTVQTYVDRVDLGVTACLEAVPDVGILRDDIMAGWLELKAAALPQARMIPIEAPVVHAPSPGSAAEAAPVDARAA
jgi:diacylglycerol O-acyltransferase